MKKRKRSRLLIAAFSGNNRKLKTDAANQFKSKLAFTTIVIRLKYYLL